MDSTQVCELVRARDLTGKSGTDVLTINKSVYDADRSRWVLVTEAPPEVVVAPKPEPTIEVPPHEIDEVATA